MSMSMALPPDKEALATGKCSRAVRPGSLWSFTRATTTPRLMSAVIFLLSEQVTRVIYCNGFADRIAGRGSGKRMGEL